MKKDKFFIMAVLISILALVLRLWRLGTVPVSLHWDEAAWGYNAYSILQTGRDEYGQLFPFIIKSFGDYKPAFYMYLAALSEAIFGLNEFAVRLPSAIFGSLSVFLLFFVVKEIFAGFKGRKVIALVSSFILAISPWHYHYSHGAWEINVMMFFILLGIWFFLKKLFYYSAFSFGLCFYIYQGAKMLVPLILAGLLVFFWKRFITLSRKTIVSSALVFGLIVLPIFISIFFAGAGGRLKVMSIFSYPRPTEEAQVVAKEAGTTPGSLQFNIFHGPPNYFARGVLGRYLNHLSARFLFFEGDWSNPRHNVPNSGVLNFLSIIFLPLGAFFLIKEKIKNQAFLWYLTAISPLPAALSRDIVQATRSLFLVFPLTVITAFGVYFAWQLVKKLPVVLKWGIVSILAFGWFFSFAFYLDQFFVHAPVAYSEDWLYGYKQAVDYIKDRTDEYDQVVFTQKYGQPYIYYLFYTQYNPRQYQAQAKLIENTQGDVGRVERIDNIDFHDIYWPKERFLKNRLFVGGPYELPLKDVVEGESKFITEIKYLNGNIAFRIVETVK